MDNTQKAGAIGDLEFAIDWIEQAQRRIKKGKHFDTLASFAKGLGHIKGELESDVD